MIISSPIITRLYSPSSFGLFGLYFTYVSVVQVASALTYDTAIVAARDRREGGLLTFGGVLLGLPTSVAFAALMYGLIQWNVLGMGGLPLATVPVAMASLLLMNCFMCLRYWAIREGRFLLVSSETVVRAGGRTTTQLIGGAISGTLWGLVFGELVGRGMGLGRLFLTAWRDLKTTIFPLRFADLRSTLVKYRWFASYSAPSTLLDTLIRELPVPLTVVLFGLTAGGYVAFDVRIFAIPLALIGASVGDVFYHRMGKLSREQPDSAKHLLLRTVKLLFLVGLVPAAVLGIFGQELFGFVFGSQWTVAGELAGAMAPWFLAQFCVFPVSTVVFVFRGQRMKLAYDLVALILSVATYGMAKLLHYSLLQTVLQLSLVNVIVYLWYLWLLLRIVDRGVVTGIDSGETLSTTENSRAGPGTRP
jgi:O-antigen/teichoic acid export membrane protein